MSQASVAIPQKLFFKIGEVCELAGVQAHVLRYWETEFPMLAPQKNRAGQRTYRRRDVEMALRIYTATDGVIANVMKLIRHATIMALDMAKSSLSLDVLQIVYEQRLAGNHPERENPFLTGLNDLKLLRPRRVSPPSLHQATNNRSKASPRQTRASDVL